MNFSIQRGALLEALQSVQAVVEKRNTVQILGNILLSLRGNELSLAGTDLEVGVKVVIPAQGGSDGKITLSAKHFLEIVRELPDAEIQIARKENQWVELICGKSRFNIVSLPADEYPALPAFEEKTYLAARVDSLAEMIDCTQFAVSTDATRYHLNGVYFEHLENSVMRMTATDAHRLSFVDREVFLDAPDLKRGIIIPRKGLMEIRRLLDESESSIGLAFERGYVFASSDNPAARRRTFLFVRLIDGEYPDCRLVIPKSAERSVKVGREEFTAALKRVSLLAHEKSRGVKFAISKNLVTIFSSNPDMGEAREELDAIYEGEALEVGFNSKYLLDFLGVMKSSQLEFKLKDRLSPAIIRGDEEKNHTYVIMPMRI